MRLHITDVDTGRELWTVHQCAEHCDITATTWRSYRSRGTLNPSPEPVARLDGRTPLWDADEVREWHASRPGSPVRNSPGRGGGLAKADGWRDNSQEQSRERWRDSQ